MSEGVLVERIPEKLEVFRAGNLVLELHKGTITLEFRIGTGGQVVVEVRTGEGGAKARVDDRVVFRRNVTIVVDGAVFITRQRRQGSCTRAGSDLDVLAPSRVNRVAHGLVIGGARERDVQRARIGGQERRNFRVLAVLVEDGLAAVVVHADDNLRPVADGTDNTAEHELGGVLGGGVTVPHTGFGANKVIGQDEVDNTGNRVRTVGGGGTVLEDFETLNR